MQTIGTTNSGFAVIAINPDEQSPMLNHRGGEIAVDDEQKRMYAWGVFVATYGQAEIMRACNQYHCR